MPLLSISVPLYAGTGLIKRLPKFAATFGNTALLIIDPFFYDDFSVRVPKLFEDAGMKAYCVKFPATPDTRSWTS